VPLGDLHPRRIWWSASSAWRAPWWRVPVPRYLGVRPGLPSPSTASVPDSHDPVCRRLAPPTPARVVARIMTGSPGHSCWPGQVSGARGPAGRVRASTGSPPLNGGLRVILWRALPNEGPRPHPGLLEPGGIASPTGSTSPSVRRRGMAWGVRLRMFQACFGRRSAFLLSGCSYHYSSAVIAYSAWWGRPLFSLQTWPASSRSISVVPRSG